MIDESDETYRLDNELIRRYHTGQYVFDSRIQAQQTPSKPKIRACLNLDEVMKLAAPLSTHCRSTVVGLTDLSSERNL